jgi:hypothetical protein
MISVAFAAASLPAHALAPAGLQALAQLEKGRWLVRDLDAGVDHGAFCLADPMALIQIEHAGGDCASEVIENGDDGGTVRYTCRGHGFGQSTIRVATPRSARIDTQGIKDNTPFSYRAEARKIGDC